MDKNLSEEELRKNAKEFEILYLLPKGSDGKELDIRMKICSQWSGWIVKADVIQSVGLVVGDTILAKARPLYLNGLIDDDEIPLFVGGDAARYIIENNVTRGTTIDCRVQFSYSKIRLDEMGDEIYRLSLVLKECYKIVSTFDGEDTNDYEAADEVDLDDFRRILSAE